MSASGPNPRYYKDGAGRRPNWRFALRWPRTYLWFKAVDVLPWRWAKWLRLPLGRKPWRDHSPRRLVRLVYPMQSPIDAADYAWPRRQYAHGSGFQGRVVLRIPRLVGLFVGYMDDTEQSESGIRLRALGRDE